MCMRHQGGWDTPGQTGLDVYQTPGSMRYTRPNWTWCVSDTWGDAIYLAKLDLMCIRHQGDAIYQAKLDLMCIRHQGACDIPGQTGLDICDGGIWRVKIGMTVLNKQDSQQKVTWSVSDNNEFRMCAISEHNIFQAGRDKFWVMINKVYQLTRTAVWYYHI